MTDTVTLRCAPSTAHASRYLQQLCKHWGHKFDVTFDPATGRVPFDNGVVCDLAATPDHLSVALTGPADEAERMCGVFERHLVRFAHREPGLVFDWTRDA